MTTIDIIGSAGVLMLLLAYFLNLFNYVQKNGHTYIWMNFIGAGLACYASTLLQYIPFVILEGVWSAVSAAAIIKKYFLKSITA
jgi:hypothetical protein